MATFSPLSGSPTSVTTPETYSVPSSLPPTSAPSTTTTTTTTASTTTAAAAAAVGTGKKPAKPRKRVNTAEKRSQHNAIERARRETLNGKFLSLARLLPSLASSRRPSKSAIVNGSIAHLTFQRSQRLLASRLLKQLVTERDELLRECNEWRQMSGYAVKEGAARGWTEEMEEVAGVEKEVFGVFAGMDGDGDEEGDEEGMFDAGMQQGMAQVQAQGGMAMGMGMNMGMGMGLQQMYGNTQLVTPRNSMGDAPATATAAPYNWSAAAAADFYQLPGSVPSTAIATPGPYGSSPAHVTGPATATAVLTPPMTAVEAASVGSAGMYSHTPSPASSHGLAEVKERERSASQPAQQQATAGAGAQAQAGGLNWSPQQFAFLQTQMAAAQFQQAQSQALASASASASAPFNPVTGNSFNAMFQGGGVATGQGQGQGSRQMQQQQQASAQQQGQQGTDAFTQQLVASMFAQQGKYGLPAQPSLSDFQKAVRAGMGLGLGMVNAWSQESSAVEGF
ncbi:hypothetical protein IAT38_000752 [Cryptococcus sp. DSM 104549]